jgi:hypothetical protein
MRRIEVDMSQQTLGGHIDLTFQQIQKYEKGMTGSARAGSSRSEKSSKSRRPTFSKARPEAGNQRAPEVTGRRTPFLNFSAHGRTVARWVIFYDSGRQAPAQHR